MYRIDAHITVGQARQHPAEDWHDDGLARWTAGFLESDSLNIWMSTATSANGAVIPGDIILMDRQMDEVRVVRPETVELELHPGALLVVQRSVFGGYSASIMWGHGAQERTDDRTPADDEAWLDLLRIGRVR